MYEYKKISFELTGSNLSNKKINESLDEMFSIIEETAKDGWKFVQTIHPYSTSTACMLIFEKEIN